MTASPLVSCIMPTKDRRAFVPRAIERFLAQDYEPRELVILDDGADPVRDCVPDDPRIRYLRSDQVLSLGRKRNALCQESRGEIVVHWDDDDWYPRWRVSRQVEALEAPHAAVSGTSTQFFYEPASGRAWQYTYWGEGGFVTGSTLAYRRSLWKEHPFEDVRVGEDTRFVTTVPRAEVIDLQDPSLCVGTVHGGNASRKWPRSPTWAPIEPRRVLALIHDGRASGDEPLTATCIMPTADRRGFVEVALGLFLAQEDVRSELIVVDSGRRTVEDLCRGVARVRYVRAQPGASIGAQRNLACDLACGDVVVHWDDDDWYGPERLRRQIEPIAGDRADVTGLENRYTLSLPDGAFWTTSEELHRRMFVGNVHGGTLAFRRSLLRSGLRYRDVNIAEDAALLAQIVRIGGRLERVPNEGTFVYVRHGRNAWRFATGEFLDPRGWERTAAPEAMPAEAIERYRALAGADVAPPAAAADEGCLDCLGGTRVVAPDTVPQFDRCVVLVATEPYADYLDGALASLDRFGGLAGVPRVVFVEEHGSRCEAVAREHDAFVVKYQPLRGRTPSVKGAVYSVTRVVKAAQYLCIDADVLVLDSLAPLFEQHAKLPKGRVLIAREATRVPVPTLADALATVYQATAEDIDVLTRAHPVVAAEPYVLNDGVFVADMAALSAADEVVRASADLRAWVRAAPNVWWRPKAALNVAMAQLGAIVLLDGAYNVQLHVDTVQSAGEIGRPVALWGGRLAAVLDFNGSARAASYARWRLGVLGVD